MRWTPTLVLVLAAGTTCDAGAPILPSDVTGPTDAREVGPDADADVSGPDADADADADAAADADADADADVRPDTGDPLESYRQRCVDEINRYRATEGKAPYTRWRSAESCADGEARSDSESGIPHGAFPSCGEWAQNECPGWGSLEDTVTGCLAMMWAEGPGEPFSEHGHYINMSSTSYSEVACGCYVTPGGSVWAVQDFR